MSNRNAYRHFTPQQVIDANNATWERMEFNGVPVRYLVDSRDGTPLKRIKLDFALAADRLGLRLVEADYIYELDAEGEVIIDPKTNKKVVATQTLPVHDWKCNVAVTGFVDAYGTPIPKGIAYFVNDNEPANRPLDEVHSTKFMKRLPTFMINGEVLIKDWDKSGQNEQHRQTAVCMAYLLGKPIPSDGIDVLTIDGINPEVAGSIDTGKQKSAADDIGSNADILANCLSLQDYKAGKVIGDVDTGFGANEKQVRVQIAKELQGIAKRVCLRLIGKNIKASVFSGFDSAGNVSDLVTSWEGLDELVNMAYVYVTSIPMKAGEGAAKYRVRPVSTWEVSVAYACWSLRDSLALQFKKAEELSVLLPEYQFPKIDLAPLKEFLIELENGSLVGQGPLADWCRDRVSASSLKQSDESRFGQVLLAMKLYIAGEPVTADLNKASKTGKDKESATKFSFMGGGDRGPIVKAAKE